MNQRTLEEEERSSSCSAMTDMAVALAKSVVEATLCEGHTVFQAEAKLPQITSRDLVFIREEFEMMRSSLYVTNAERLENQVARTWVRQVRDLNRLVRDLANDVEHCVDLALHFYNQKTGFWFRVRRICLPCTRVRMRTLDQEMIDTIEQLKARLTEVSTRTARYSLISDTGSKPVAQQLLPSAAVGDSLAASNMLAEARDADRRAQGHDLSQLITEKKIGDDHQDLQVISVWGSGGAHGTASVIMNTYSDPEMCRYFTYRAWVKLMHPFSPLDFIRSLMAQFYAAECSKEQQQKHASIGMGLVTMMQATPEVLFNDFEKLVTQARYLLVLEDLSNMAEWHDLMAFLPNTGKGSWVIVSTQKSEIASLCIGPSYKILEMKQFSAEHSVCALFKKGSHTDGNKGKKPFVEDSMLVGHDSPMKSGSEPQHLSLHYLKDITNNFSDEQILGSGAFGVVYKGVPQNGEAIAVKKLLESVPRSHEQFEKEIDLLMKIKHPNIVRLIGYCYETQHLRLPYEGKLVFAGSTELLLCLECLPNGSLDKYISDASTGLDWCTRWKIIEGISYGIDHLHEKSNGPILHLDLKPANILLDENMLPKITDFGVSRLFDQNQSIHTANAYGTFGYMSPEYIRGIITPMSDIFSLGVIILEVITGHRKYPYDISTSSQDDFIEIELQKWRNRLQEEPAYASLEEDCKLIERCIQIGLMCVNPEGTKRPTMKKIIDMLRG